MQAGRSRKKASQVDEQKVADNVLATADERKTSRSLSGKMCALLHDDHADHVHFPFEPPKKKTRNGRRSDQSPSKYSSVYREPK